MIRVIYKDQTAGVVERHLLDELIRKGRIVAYHSDGAWIPIVKKGYPGNESFLAGASERGDEKVRRNLY